MGLLSIFQSKSRGAAKAPAPEPSVDAVQQARTRARRRLIGAAVLVVAGIIGFPLLFETQPRPIPVDIPIEIPRKEGAPPLVMPAARPKLPAVTAPAPQTPPSAPEKVITETSADGGRELPAPAGKAASVTPIPKPSEANKASTTAAKPLAKPASTNTATDSNRAQALLEGKAGDKDAARKEGARYVVQVGAFTDSAAARETRLKVEKLGLKTYTQVAETPSGSRIRVRVGPFTSRDEADRALAKAKAAGMTAVVLTL